ncbi:dihydrolipoyl dehydrogenase [Desulfosporosinus sp. BICA1-9]|uniref:dihydrolipoyl dehydrogenase n=1 Tax=Desulfosporosinus sp. BICA1-9 TaxID=1531958 RepID=UPI00054BC4A6|nr:dihydrolipoyl dehydrogenase [Desulfosporosinus sp. BICA1-9]KJS89778.1 MAG: pyridine nucleotide-disulfide oxidoreductase [Desulfosporosinus sp. BICA1-9]HBW38123.1 dihydrolipoyl dehydrogenase [Desulfosporosinus sp.]
MEHYQVGILGGGPGGYVCALRAAQLGLSVVLVEGDRLGGTCLNRGCIPTKALVKSADLWRELQHAEEFGIQAGENSFDFAKMIERKDRVVNTLVSGVEQLFKAAKIQVIKGWGEITEAGRINVETESGKVSLEVENLVIATGSTPFRIPIPGVNLDGVMTSDNILDEKTLPEKLVIIGGGVIGLEFASIFQALGVKITVVEMLPSLLANIDEEIPKRLNPVLKKTGIDILTKTMVKEIKSVENGLVTVVENAKGIQEIQSDRVLMATGRRFNLRGVNTEQLGLELERGAIAVDSQMRTSVPNIYAIGDVTGKMMLAHVASAQGMVVAEHIAGHQVEMSYRAVPSAIFTHPEIAAVGATEQELKAADVKYKVSKFPFSANGKAIALGETIGIVKILTNEEGIVLGSSIMGPQASSLIQELVLAVEKGLNAEELAKTIHAHPTLPEAVMEAAHGILEKPLHFA